MIHAWKTIYKQDVRIFLQVHDEIVCDCPEDKAEFYADKIKQLMKRAAKNYLIPEIEMDVDVRVGKFWKK